MLTAACAVGILASAFISSMTNFQGRSALFFLGAGALLALAILALVTAANRLRIAPMKAKGAGIDFMIRPFKAMEKAVGYVLAVLGLFALFALASGDTSIMFEQKLTFYPALAMGLAIYATAYTEFDR